MSDENLYSYVIVFDGLTVPEFTRAIDKLEKSIPNWYTVLPQTVFVVSPLDASKLSDRLREKIPQIRRLLVLDANTDRNGWLPQAAWSFLKRPQKAKEA
jgi:hypothetical protein